MKKAIRQYGSPKQLVFDQGVQFTSIAREGCKHPEDSNFQKFLKENNIQHIKARVKQPQTNGKLERWWQTLKHNTEHFQDLQYAV